MQVSRFSKSCFEPAPYLPSFAAFFACDLAQGGPPRLILARQRRFHCNDLNHVAVGLYILDSCRNPVTFKCVRTAAPQPLSPFLAQFYCLGSVAELQNAVKRVL